MGTHTPWQGALMPSAVTPASMSLGEGGAGTVPKELTLPPSSAAPLPLSKIGRTTELGRKRVSVVGEGVCVGCVCDMHTDSVQGFQPRARLLRLTGD